jgi:TonB-dependent starch-binding outer membrane protein SusC
MTISAQIFDNEMGSIEGVNVFELGTQNSTQTDKDGRFTLSKVASANSDIRFTHVGYDYDTVKASYFDKMTYFNLYPNSTELNPISVGGHVVTKPKDYTNWLLIALGLLGIYAITKNINSNQKPKPTTTKKQPLKVRM